MNKYYDISIEEDAKEILKLWEETTVFCNEKEKYINGELEIMKSSPEEVNIPDNLFTLIYKNLNIYTNQLPKELEYLKNHLEDDNVTLTIETYNALLNTVDKAKTWKRRFMQLKKRRNDLSILPNGYFSYRCIDFSEVTKRLRNK